MRRDLAIAVALAAATAAAYLPLRHNGFVRFDDHGYVYENIHVTDGLTWDGFLWSFAPHLSNWHPLTWLSHMLDCQLFGLDAGAHHLVSLAMHAASAILLYLVLRRMTGAAWPSAAAAVLFALHPLHVESVAWISERKDVLSGLLAMLTLLAYVRYVERPGPARYLVVVVLFALGLMAKPMLVTLPLVLLLLDYWPLGRIRWGAGEDPARQGDAVASPARNQRAARRNAPAADRPHVRLGRLLLEKAPLLSLAAASGVITWVAQYHGGAVVPMANLPVASRLANAVVSYAAYLGMAAVPVGLSPLYLYDMAIPGWKVAGAAAALAAATAAALWFARRRPYLAVGWLWYVGTLVPVIGIVQVGDQAVADRYTYIPLIGIFIIVSWGAADLAGRWRHGRTAAAAAGAGAAAACMVLTCVQAGYWATTESLFEHAIAVSADASRAHVILGDSLRHEGRYNDAVAHYKRAIDIDPLYGDARTSLGHALVAMGRPAEAVQPYEHAIQLNPRSAEAHSDLGAALAGLGRMDEAMAHFRKAVEVQPDGAEWHHNLASALARQGRLGDAIAEFREAIRLSPEFAQAHYHLGLALGQRGDLDGAAAELREAARLAPNDAKARLELGEVLARQSKAAEAAAQYRETVARFRELVRQRPDNADARANLAYLLQLGGETPEAIEHFREAVRLRPEGPAALNALAWILATHPDPMCRSAEEAVRLAERVCKLDNRTSPSTLDTLAAAYAEAGRFPEARAAAQAALTLAEATNQGKLADRIRDRLRLYETGLPYREAAPTAPGVEKERVQNEK